jgi:hypothetical protein
LELRSSQRSLGGREWEKFDCGTRLHKARAKRSAIPGTQISDGRGWEGNTMKLDPYDFTYFAAVNRLYPHAKIEPGSVEGPYCAVRKCPPEAHEIHSDEEHLYRLKLFTDPLKAKQWTEECHCRTRKPEDHFVQVVESLEPPESVAFQDVEDWRQHHA